MINTYSRFYYGLTISGTNKYIDFDEGSGELNAEIQTGTYTPEDLADAVQEALNNTGTYNYTVSFNRTSRILTIASSSPVDWLAATGTNVGLGTSAYATLGYPAVDILGSTSFTASSAIATVYLPQYKLQDFVDQEDSRKNRSPSVAVAASGKVQLQTFGIDRMFEMNIRFATNIFQPSGGPILNNQNGVQNLRNFMRWVSNKNTVEFMPDTNAPNTYFRLVLDTAPGAGDGSGYRLQEQFSRGLVGYYDTGILMFRVIED